MPDKLTLAVVGLGFGRHLMQNEMLKGRGAPFLDVVAACDVDREKTDAVAGQWGLKACYDLEDVLWDPAIEVVGLFTGPVGRADLVRRCIRAGKHVMTTKPFDLDPAAALSVLQEARQLGRVVHLNSPAPLPSADLRRILAWREQYALGPVVASRWETYCRYNEQADGRWYDDPALCPVAPIFRLGIYGINEMVRVLGEPESVGVQHARLFTGRPTPDNAQLTIRFRDGAMGSVLASFCINNGHAYPNTWTLHFENGTVCREKVRLPGDDAEERVKLELRGQRDGQGIAESVTLAAGDCDGMYQWEALRRAVRGECLADEITPGQIASGVRVIGAMARSEQSGRIEAV